MTGRLQNCGRCSRLVETIFPILSQRNATPKLRVRLRTGNVHRYSPCEGSRSVQTSTTMCKIFEVPSSSEVESLKKLYHNPKCLIHDLLQPLVSSGVTVRPKVNVEARLGGRYWRAKLQLHWPSKVIVSAVHDSVAGAEENAYLLACDLLKNMGLLYKPPSEGMLPVSQDHIMSILHTLHCSFCHPFSPSPPPFHFTTKLSSSSSSSSSSLDGHGHGKSGRDMWRTDVAVSWPYIFDVSSLGPSCQASKHAAALRTGIKLKALGLLSHDNSLSIPRLSAIARQQKSSASWEHFDPHYQIYSDASAFGFGAYLVKKDDHPVHWMANTWSEHFPDSPCILARQKQPIGDTNCKAVYMESTFCELYSVVTACFTWKHKLVGKRVLVWSDSQAIVHMINWGLHGEAKLKRWGKLFSILSATCQKYSIELRAGHVHRSENIAADMLSRYQVSAFKEAVPEAAPSQKKTKKLLFWNPLQLSERNPDLQPKII